MSKNAVLIEYSTKEELVEGIKFHLDLYPDTDIHYSVSGNKYTALLVYKE